MRIGVLDLLRFVAALAVVLYHYTARSGTDSFPYLAQITKFGYLGVPIFFVISGYVISMSASNRSAKDFAISRLVRLYPAYWLAVLFTAALTVVFGGQAVSLAQVAANLTMLNDYMGYANIDGVYWTLQAELKFYACIFLLLAFGLFPFHKIWLPLWLLLTAIHLGTQQPFFMGWFISPGYSSFFIGGIAFFLLSKEGPNRLYVTIFLGSLAVSCVRAFHQAPEFMREPTMMDRYFVVAIVLATYGLFFFLATGHLKFRNRPVFTVLGGLTYPLYLLHNVAGKLIIDKLKVHVVEEICVALVVGLMLCLSYAVYAGVERRVAGPMKRGLRDIFATVSQVVSQPKKKPIK